MNSKEMLKNIDITRFYQSGLIDIQFANFGQSVVLEFCADDGQSLGYLICHDVLRFHYIDPAFKQGQYSQIQGFSHYIHQFHIYQREQHLHVTLRPYVELDIECQAIECVEPTAMTIEHN